jgi:hypothetical protein
MQTITISIQGSVSVSETVQVSDEAALPLFIRLKETFGSWDTPKPRGRRRKDLAASEEAAAESANDRGDLEGA